MLYKLFGKKGKAETPKQSQTFGDVIINGGQMSVAQAGRDLVQSQSGENAGQQQDITEDSSDCAVGAVTRGDLSFGTDGGPKGRASGLSQGGETGGGEGVSRQRFDREESEKCRGDDEKFEGDGDRCDNFTNCRRQDAEIYHKCASDFLAVS